MKRASRLGRGLGSRLGALGPVGLCLAALAVSSFGTSVAACGASGGSTALIPPLAEAGTAPADDDAGTPHHGGDPHDPPSTPASPIDLRADVNRNGTVDLDDPTEDAAEDTWDAAHGAIFLANIDDDTSRCPTTGTDDQLAACNDAADEVVNGDADLADMAHLAVRAWPGAPAGAVGRLSVTVPGAPADAAPHVRLFVKTGAPWAAASFAPFDPATGAISTDALRAGADFVLEGLDVVRDADAWNGFVDVTLDVVDGGTDLGSDVVRLRVAPVVTPNHLLAPTRVYAAQLDESDSVAFRNDLQTAMTAAGIAEPLSLLPTGDQWSQDYFETGTMSMPAAGGPHVIDVAYRSANFTRNRLRTAGKLVFTLLRGPDSAGIQQYTTHDAAMDSLNSFGNFETIPPYTLGAKSYPLGRVIRGSTATFYPDPSFQKMVVSQGYQPPVYIDTSWLLVGHVDETFSFVKAATPRGWALVVADPRLAVKILQTTAASDPGATLFAGEQWSDGSSAEISVESALADTQLMAASQAASVAIDAELAVLATETGITDAEIFRVPVLFDGSNGSLVAFTPGVVNGISLGDADFGPPVPHGPSGGGAKDPFVVATESALAPLGIRVRWIEDWSLYHAEDGEVHCGSNTRRRLSSVPWWTVQP